jgi:mannose-6-phosphate isomerase-like protein (cupin superfamily)
MKTFALADLLSAQRAGSTPYLEFLREASLSAGLYVLPISAIDRQSPHTEDEIYVVLAGTALFTAGDQTRPVQRGDTLFVAAGVPHRFHDVTDELHLVVVFAPPEGSVAPR